MASSYKTDGLNGVLGLNFAYSLKIRLGFNSVLKHKFGSWSEFTVIDVSL